MKTLFVGNIKWSTDEFRLRAALEEFGEVGEVRVIRDRDTGRSKGFAFVEMADEGALKAKDELNEKNIVDGRPWMVKDAIPKQEQRRFRRTITLSTPNLFLGNLDYAISEEKLRAALEPFGKLLRITIVKDRESETSRGFGFAEFVNLEDAQNAINILNGTWLDGRFVSIEQARPEGQTTEHEHVRFSIVRDRKPDDYGLSEVVRRQYEPRW